MTFYPEALQELIDEFKEVNDKRERLEMVFELADEVVVLPTDEWTEDTRIRGCQSEAHVRIGVNEGLVQHGGRCRRQTRSGAHGRAQHRH